jgi:hypothetical protein
MLLVQVLLLLVVVRTIRVAIAGSEGLVWFSSRLSFGVEDEEEQQQCAENNDGGKSFVLWRLQVRLVALVEVPSGKGGGVKVVGSVQVVKRQMVN